MVSTLTLVNLMISIVLILGAPLVFFWIFRSKRGMFRTMAAGAMAFFIAQYVLRLPILNSLLTSPSMSFVLDNVWLYALLLAFSAALFEFVLRVIVLKWIMADYQKKHHVISAGFGHGAIEAIFLVALTYINNIIISLMINSNRIDELFNEASDPNLINQVINGLVNADSWVFLLGGLERMMVIIIQIALTILAFQGLKDKTNRVRYWITALLIHTALDFIIVMLQLNSASLWLMEGVVLLFMVASIFIVRDFYYNKKSEGVQL